MFFKPLIIFTHLVAPQLMFSFIFELPGMPHQPLHKILTFFIAAIWFINGFFCKLLNLVPRHELIVSRTLGPQYAMPLTKIIGALEVLMAVWIVSRIMPRMNALTQIMVIATMNALEFFLVPDLLLWGKGNAVFAFLLILLIIYNEFYLNKSAVSELES